MALFVEVSLVIPDLFSSRGFTQTAWMQTVVMHPSSGSLTPDLTPLLPHGNSWQHKAEANSSSLIVKIETPGTLTSRGFWKRSSIGTRWTIASQSPQSTMSWTSTQSPEEDSSKLNGWMRTSQPTPRRTTTASETSNGWSYARSECSLNYTPPCPKPWNQEIQEAAASCSAYKRRCSSSYQMPPGYEFSDGKWQQEITQRDCCPNPSCTSNAVALTTVGSSAPSYWQHSKQSARETASQKGQALPAPGQEIGRATMASEAANTSSRADPSNRATHHNSESSSPSWTNRQPGLSLASTHPEPVDTPNCGGGVRTRFDRTPANLPIGPASERICNGPGSDRARVSSTGRDSPERGPRTADVPLLPDPSGGETAAHSGPASAESMGAIRPLQDGRDPASSRNDSPKRLDGEDRLERCVPICPPSPISPEADGLCTSGQELQVLGHAVRPIIGPKSVYEIDERCADPLTGGRNAPSVLPRRHSCPGEDTARSSRTLRNTLEPSLDTRIDSQREKVLGPTRAECKILGDGVRLVSDDSVGAQREAPQGQTGADEAPGDATHQITKVGCNCGHACVILDGIPSSVHPPAMHAAEHYPVRQEESSMGPRGPDISTDKERDQVVDLSHDTIQRTPDRRGGIERDSHIHGRIKDWMGMRSKDVLRGRVLGRSRSGPIQQLQGIESNIPDASHPSERAEESDGDNSLGQHHIDSPDKRAIESSPPTSTTHCETDLESRAAEPHTDPCGPRKGRRQRRRRSPKPPFTRARVDVVPNDLPRDRQSPRSMRGRPLCIIGKRSDEHIRDETPLSTGHGDGRPENVSLAPILVCEPTPNSDPASSAKTPGNGPPDSPIDSGVAIPAMVARMGANSTKETVDNCSQEIDCQPKRPRLQTPISKSSRLEIISGGLEGVLPETKELFLKVERKQTKKTYESLWKRFATFAQGRGRDPEDYNVNLGLDFIASLAKQSRSNICLARSMLSKTWKMRHPTLPVFGDHALTKELMKAIRESMPKRPKKRETWDVERVRSHLRTIDSEKSDLRTLSEKTVTLLAIESIWRPRSDLSRIHLKDVTITPEGMSFTARQPKEGESKSAFINRLPETAICPVATMEHYIRRTSALRRDQSLLFITHRRPHGPASADTLGRWVVRTLKAVGISATAHSVRAAASSAALKSGVLVNTILQKANWKSEATFRNFYWRPL